MADFDYLVAYGPEGLKDIKEGNTLIADGVKQIQQLNAEIRKTGFDRINVKGLEEALQLTDDLGMQMRDLTQATKDAAAAYAQAQRAKNAETKSVIDHLNVIKETIPEIAKLKGEIDSARQGGSMWKTLLGSFNVWSAAINIGINLVETFGGKLFQTRKKTDELNDSLEAADGLAKRLGETASGDISRLMQLKVAAENVNSSYRSRISAVKQLHSLYPEYFGNLSREQLLTGKVADAYKKVTDAILIKARLEVYGDQLKDIVAKVIKAEAALNRVGGDKLARTKDGEVDMNPIIKREIITGEEMDRDLSSAIWNYNLAIFEQNKLIKNIADAQLAYEKNIRRQSYDDFRKDLGERTKELNKVKEEVSTINLKIEPLNMEEVNEDLDRLWQGTEDGVETRLKDIVNNGRSDLDFLDELYKERFVGLEENFQKGLFKSVEEYEQEKYNVGVKYLQDRLKVQVANLDQQMALLDQDSAHYASLEQQKNDIISKSEEQQKNIKIKTAEEIKQALDEKRKKELQFYAELINTAMTLGSEIAGLFGDQSKSRLEALRAEADLIDQNGQKEIDRIKNSALSEEEKEKKIRIAEAKTDAQKRMNEQRQRREKLKMAKMEKMVNIGDIMGKTALAIIEAFSEGDPYSKPIRAAVAAAVGAAQLIRAISAPLPQYAQGRKNGPAEFAIVGEEGTEAVRERSGRTWLTGNSAHLAFLPAGAEVIPHHELTRNANYYVMQDMLGDNNSRQQEHLLKEFLKQNLASSKRVERSLSRMRNKTVINIDGSNHHYVIQKFNR